MRFPLAPVREEGTHETYESLVVGRLGERATAPLAKAGMVGTDLGLPSCLDLGCVEGSCAVCPQEPQVFLVDGRIGSESCGRKTNAGLARTAVLTSLSPACGVSVGRLARLVGRL